MEKMLEIGMHLVLDGYTQDLNAIGSLDRIRNFLDSFPVHMGMTKVTAPYVFQYQGGSPQEGGISGIVIIAESHISIHTFPAQGYVSVDIFSCKPFDVEEAIRNLTEYFHLTDFCHQVFDRGIEYPKEIPSVIPLVLEERLQNLEKMVHT
ncbi:MAG: S-adenosylmethionine decarboxylase [Candidatus Atribacteria bacterium]|nr:S-adenosylmethionine decarboxylase [Candidatus Atribacteria bacterium]